MNTSWIKAEWSSDPSGDFTKMSVQREVSSQPQLGLAGPELSHRTANWVVGCLEVGDQGSNGDAGGRGDVLLHGEGPSGCR